MSLEEERSSEKLLLLSLAIARSAVAPPIIVIGLLLIEIGATFGVSVGVAGQISTVSSILGIFFALLMGALSVRYNHKSLLLIGLSFFCISALGCSLAPSFNVMLIAFSITGLGSTTVISMVTTLIGEHLSLEKRTKAIGWTAAGTSLVYVFGTLIINFITGLGGWRMAFLGFVFPMILLSLLLVLKGVPPTSCSRQTLSMGSYLEGFKAVISNKSAVACLVGTALSMATWTSFIIYFASFYRQRYLASIDFVSFVNIVVSLGYISGCLICGRLVNVFGRKSLTVLSSFIVGVLAYIVTNVPNLWLSIVFGIVFCIVVGIMITAFISLTLEQIPSFRGTMMSLNSAAMSMGQMIGGSVGGLLLIILDYGVLGMWQGAMAIIAAFVFYLFAIDPIRI
ncbi:MAG: MFS transporter [Candidatus Bathyarchaeota archaeon]|nr:MAG: MFS transporter [Candidatus Bathyarchaeota archaeon]